MNNKELKRVGLSNQNIVERFNERIEKWISKLENENFAGFFDLIEDLEEKKERSKEYILWLKKIKEFLKDKNLLQDLDSGFINEKSRQKIQHNLLIRTTSHELITIRNIYSALFCAYNPEEVKEVKKTSAKKTYEVKDRYQKKEGELSVKSYCCGVMAKIRDYMLKNGIEDYKNDTSELGLARKKAVKSLMCYSKTSEASKVENLKKLVSEGLFSEEFKKWDELYQDLLNLKKEFTK